MSRPVCLTIYSNSVNDTNCTLKYHKISAPSCVYLRGHVWQRHMCMHYHTFMIGKLKRSNILQPDLHRFATPFYIGAALCAQKYSIWSVSKPWLKLERFPSTFQHLRFLWSLWGPDSQGNGTTASHSTANRAVAQKGAWRCPNLQVSWCWDLQLMDSSLRNVKKYCSTTPQSPTTIQFIKACEDTRSGKCWWEYFETMWSTQCASAFPRGNLLHSLRWDTHHMGKTVF